MSFLNHILEGDTFAIYNHIQLEEVCDDYAIASAPLRAESANADGVAQGGFVYSLADLAFAMYSNHIHPRTVTQSASITYVAPGRGPILYAKAKELSRTRHNNTVEVTVYDKNGTVAIAMFNGFISDWQE